MAMQRIENPDQWMRGKTVKKVDSKSAVNCNTILFEDGTAAYIEADHMGHGIYGPAWYEIDPNVPVHEQ
jgi:glyoxylate utilization-related uncharacterized protein